MGKWKLLPRHHAAVPPIARLYNQDIRVVRRFSIPETVSACNCANPLTVTALDGIDKEQNLDIGRSLNYNLF